MRSACPFLVASRRSASCVASETAPPAWTSSFAMFGSLVVIALGRMSDVGRPGTRLRRPQTPDRLSCVCTRVRGVRKGRRIRQFSEAIVTDAYTLPDLPYDYDALEPLMSAQVMRLHHEKHHAAYVKGANEALDKIADARSATDFSHIGQLEKNLAFNLSGHVLHSLFWECLAPDGGGRPGGRLG